MSFELLDSAVDRVLSYQPYLKKYEIKNSKVRISTRDKINTTTLKSWHENINTLQAL